MKFTKHLLFAALVATGLTVNAPKSEAAFLVTFASPAIGIILGAPSVYLIFTTKNPEIFVLATLGLVLDKNTNAIEFNTLSDSQAESLGLTSIEKESYNGELNRINASFEEMNSSIANGAEAKTALENFKADISEEAFSSVQKILKVTAQK